LEELVKTQDQYPILATAARDETAVRVLKQGETFAVFDRYGDLQEVGNHELGIYHEGTRYLSKWRLLIGGQPPLLLNSSIRKAHPLLSTDLTNPDLATHGEIVLVKGTVHILRNKFLYDGACYERLQVFNYGLADIHVSVTVSLDSDFVDLFEVRGTARERRGRRLDNQIGRNGITLRYHGLDRTVRHTYVTADPPPDDVLGSGMRFDLSLGPGASRTIFFTVTCSPESLAVVPKLSYDEALHEATCTTAALAERCRINSSSYLFNEWVSRSKADIDMMVTNTPYGPYPYAGIPWFSTPFGRDGIITALQMLSIDPNLARGVLRYLAATQATETSDVQDAQPGKILHEARLGEMAALGEVPFGRYYGSVDATPLFVALAGRYYRRTADLGLIQALWPHVERALRWIDEFGDRDGDGFVEYRRESADGLVNQGWKDSFDSIFHRDGALAEPPIALCEVQGYVYAARREAAMMAAAIGHAERARQLTEQADALRERFEAAFWCEEIGNYALALDRDKRACCVRTSNPGHCLFSGIVPERHARRVAEDLFREDLFSGWGIRTVSSGERRFNPMSYHDGSVWPHDNALIAAGLARYGFKDLVLIILTSLFDSTMHVDLHRLPELFCGFSRRPGEGPTGYPVACRPQAWAAGAVFMLLEATLGIDIDAPRRQITFSRPALPRWLQRVRIDNLAIGEDNSVDLLCERHAHDVGISVIRRRGNLTVVHHA